MKVKITENLAKVLAEPRARQQLRELIREHREGVIETREGRFRLVPSTRAMTRKAS